METNKGKFNLEFNYDKQTKKDEMAWRDAVVADFKMLQKRQNQLMAMIFGNLFLVLAIIFVLKFR